MIQILLLVANSLRFRVVDSETTLKYSLYVQQLTLDWEMLEICKTTEHLGGSSDRVCMYCQIVDIFPSTWHHQPAFLLSVIPPAAIIWNTSHCSFWNKKNGSAKYEAKLTE